jgi:iron complex transport system substrate-binding protein
MRDGRSHAERILHRVNRRAVRNDFRLWRYRLRARRYRKLQGKNKSKRRKSHKNLQWSENEVHHTRKAESIWTGASAGRFGVCYPLLEGMKASRRVPLRIVSLAPSATSILCAIGAQKFLVGVTKWCADVAPVGNLPKLGDCWHMDSLDDILDLKPTLVIGSVPYKQETVAKLLDHPLNFMAMNPRTLSDIEAGIRLLGGLTQRAAAASHLIRQMQRDFAAIAKKSRGRKRRVRVYSEAWPNPRISSPPWVSELVNICGGEMVVPAGKTVTEEEVASADPEVIILAWAATGDKSDPKKAYQVETWKDLRAIRERRVHVVRDELLNTPGPPLVRGARALFKHMHPANQLQGPR